ncbi:TlpA disulfide reductase family protein [Cytophagaceae bacterium DM2B3-1]|uniref:TlpA disulfide reductase family protein n=1 Tax=Xanthocytophaga flava TaxID=3048013 RepID=A0ABT7CF18_9BACT|nr:TlpA disulfide reductase family protein [Xanthocytophaga flavus]MDJ1492329.1 TlpA disulfide reductase family protein [Xanthocytophaga flavus]
MKKLFLTIVTILMLTSLKQIQASVKFTSLGPLDSVMNVPAPQFSLKDMSGKVVSLIDYKGKVVVLDFWATWCVPCRNSFPAMQMTMNMYQNDKNVVFLFIDTREKSPNYQSLISQFLSDNHYDFYVLLDEKGADGVQNKVYKTYQIPGIPTKFVIDGKGIIRFKNIGFDMNKTNEQVVEELAGQIEIAKTAE